MLASGNASQKEGFLLVLSSCPGPGFPGLSSCLMACSQASSIAVPESLFSSPIPESAFILGQIP